LTRRNWDIRKLAELGRIVTGRTPPSSQPNHFGLEFPFVTPTDMDGRRLIDSTQRYLSQDGSKLLERIGIPPASVMVSCIGWQLGKVAIATRQCFTNQQINTVIPNDKIEPLFLYYHLSTRRDEIRRLGSVGARTPIVNKSRFGEISIAVPPLDQQKRIVDVLQRFDELIENNSSRISALEQVARRLFDEWFVQLRAPSVESLPISKTTLGRMPNEWSAANVKDVASFISRGIAPCYADEGRSIVINQKCIRDGRLSLVPSRRQSKPIPLEKLVVKGDVLINSTGVGTLGRVAQVERIEDQVTVDSHVTIVRPKPGIDRDFFGLALLRLQPTLEALGVGSTGQTELGRDRIKKLDLIVPPKNVQQTFGRIVRPMRALAYVLDLQNTNLRAQRDLLLPKLISGEIDLSYAEHIMQAAE
jgi:type I restriction enzyme S subunit